MSASDDSPPSRYSPGRGRSAGFFLALLAEGLLVLLVLGFGSSIMNPESFGSAVDIVRFRAVPQEETPEPAEEKAAPEEKQDEPQPEETAKPQEEEPVPDPPPPQPEPPQPRKPPPPMPKTIPLAPPQPAPATVAPARPSAPAPPPAAKGQQYGPPDTVGRTASDSAVVSGSGPNGETLYAAAWYREPYADELSGYLSTATGPGWGLIACRTASDFRVEDCIAVDEYPAGSNINRAILAAAWQFKVRPPRVGGQTRVGEWVRIRIDYGTRRN